MSELIVDRSGSGWEKVKRSVFDDKLLSIEAKGVMGWLLTRRKGHKIYVWHLQKECGISAHIWETRISKELKNAGYLSHEKIRVNGEIDWTFSITDNPHKKDELIKMKDVNKEGLSNGGFVYDGKKYGPLTKKNREWLQGKVVRKGTEKEEAFRKFESTIRG